MNKEMTIPKKRYLSFSRKELIFNIYYKENQKKENYVNSIQTKFSATCLDAIYMVIKQSVAT